MAKINDQLATALNLLSLDLMSSLQNDKTLTAEQRLLMYNRAEVVTTPESRQQLKARLNRHKQSLRSNNKYLVQRISHVNGERKSKLEELKSAQIKEIAYIDNLIKKVGTLTITSKAILSDLSNKQALSMFLQVILLSLQDFQGVMDDLIVPAANTSWFDKDKRNAAIQGAIKMLFSNIFYATSLGIRDLDAHDLLAVFLEFKARLNFLKQDEDLKPKLNQSCADFLLDQVDLTGVFLEVDWYFSKTPINVGDKIVEWIKNPENLPNRRATELFDMLLSFINPLLDEQADYKPIMAFETIADTVESIKENSRISLTSDGVQDSLSLTRLNKMRYVSDALFKKLVEFNLFQRQQGGTNTKIKKQLELRFSKLLRQAYVDSPDPKKGVQFDKLAGHWDVVAYMKSAHYLRVIYKEVTPLSRFYIGAINNDRELEATKKSGLASSLNNLFNGFKNIVSQLPFSPAYYAVCANLLYSQLDTDQKIDDINNNEELKSFIENELFKLIGVREDTKAGYLQQYTLREIKHKLEISIISQVVFDKSGANSVCHKTSNIQTRNVICKRDLPSEMMAQFFNLSDVLPSLFSLGNQQKAGKITNILRQIMQALYYIRVDSDLRSLIVFGEVYLKLQKADQLKGATPPVVPQTVEKPVSPPFISTKIKVRADSPLTSEVLKPAVVAGPLQGEELSQPAILAQMETQSEGSLTLEVEILPVVSELVKVPASPPVFSTKMEVCADGSLTSEVPTPAVDTGPLQGEELSQPAILAQMEMPSKGSSTLEVATPPVVSEPVKVSASPPVTSMKMEVRVDDPLISAVSTPVVVAGPAQDEAPLPPAMLAQMEMPSKGSSTLDVASPSVVSEPVKVPASPLVIPSKTEVHADGLFTSEVPTPAVVAGSVQDEAPLPPAILAQMEMPSKGSSTSDVATPLVVSESTCLLDKDDDLFSDAEEEGVEDLDNMLTDLVASTQKAAEAHKAAEAEVEKQKTWQAHLHHAAKYVVPIMVLTALCFTGLGLVGLYTGVGSATNAVSYAFFGMGALVHLGLQGASLVVIFAALWTSIAFVTVGLVFALHEGVKFVHEKIADLSGLKQLDPGSSGDKAEQHRAEILNSAPEMPILTIVPLNKVDQSRQSDLSQNKSTVLSID